MVSSFAVVALLACASPEGAVRCPLAVDDEVSPPWLDAARALPALDPEESDCARIHLEAHALGARLVYSTREGGEAVRVLESPDELAPTIAALGARAPRTRSLREEQAPNVPMVPNVSNVPIVPMVPIALAVQPAIIFSAEPVSSTRSLCSLQAGVRGGAGGSMSPMLRALFALTEEPLEIGVGAEWDLRYYDPREGKTSAQALSASVTASFRDPIGDFAALAGGKLALGAYFYADPQPINARMPGDYDPTGASADVRIGAFGGIVWPRSSTVRLRVELGADFAPYGTSSGDVSAIRVGTQAPDIESRSPPLWSLTGSFGVEVGSP